VNYSFNRNHAVIALQHLKMIAPGAVCGYCIYLSQEDNLLHYTRFFRGNEPEDNVISDEDNIISNLRKPRKTPIQWFTPDNVPIKNNISGITQLEIFSESEHTVMCLRIDSMADSNQDLVFIELKQDLSAFGINPADGKLEVQTKKILGLLLHNSVMAVIRAAESDARLHRDLSRNTLMLIDTVKKSKEAVCMEQSMHKQSIERLAKEYLDGISQQYNRKILLSDDAAEKLWKQREAIHKINHILANAVQFAVNITATDPSTPLIIGEELLFLNESSDRNNQPPHVTSVTRTISKELKAEQFLYKLLRSVEKLLAKGHNITGKMVGANCEPSVSAPAITEFIKKYRKQILNLIKEDPSKWALLINEFRPIQNVYYSSPGVISKTG